MISFASDFVMMPHSASMAACALDPRISCGASALSKAIEAFISCMISAGEAANRPPHILLAGLSVTERALRTALENGQDDEREAVDRPAPYGTGYSILGGGTLRLA